MLGFVFDSRLGGRDLVGAFLTRRFMQEDSSAPQDVRDL